MSHTKRNCMGMYSLVTNEIVWQYAEKSEFKIVNKIDINDELLLLKECVELDVKMDVFM